MDIDIDLEHPTLSGTPLASATTHITRLTTSIQNSVGVTGLKVL